MNSIAMSVVLLDYLQLLYKISAAYFLGVDEGGPQGIVKNMAATFAPLLADNKWF